MKICESFSMTLRWTKIFSLTLKKMNYLKKKQKKAYYIVVYRVYFDM